MDDKRGLFRVNYYDVGGQPKTGFVVAFSDVEAATFLGVQNNSGVQVTRDRYPVEVAGLDGAHAGIPSIPPSTAPFDAPKGVSRGEFEALEAQVAALKKSAPVSGGPTPVQPGPTAAKE